MLCTIGNKKKKANLIGAGNVGKYDVSATGNIKKETGKMNHTYCVRTDKILDECGIPYTVYGIDAINDRNDLLVSVPDIFFDSQKATAFVSLCNRLEVSLVHLSDVIEDILI